MINNYKIIREVMVSFKSILGLVVHSFGSHNLYELPLTIAIVRRFAAAINDTF
jgi:hypothetical protein